MLKDRVCVPPPPHRYHLCISESVILSHKSFPTSERYSRTSGILGDTWYTLCD